MSGAPSSQLTGLAQARQSLTDLKARQATERSNFWEQHQASCKALQAQQLVVLQQEWLNLEQACTDLDNQAGAQERLLHEVYHWQHRCSSDAYLPFGDT